MILARNCNTDDEKLSHAMAARVMLDNQDEAYDSTLCLLFECENIISTLLMGKKKFSAAESHCEQSLMSARLIKGIDRVHSERIALITFSRLRTEQFRYLEAVDLSEKLYILVSKKHGPVHPQVQEAATMLINALIQSGNDARADNYSRMNLENLTDPKNVVDQMTHQIAESMKQIADIWTKLPTPKDEKIAFQLAEEAEDMTRKSLKIVERLFGKESPNIIPTVYLLGAILVKRDKYTEDTRIVLEHLLYLCRLQRMPEFRTDVVYALQGLARFHAHMSEIAPPGTVREKERMLKEKYTTEMAVIQRN